MSSLEKADFIEG